MPSHGWQYQSGPRCHDLIVSTKVIMGRSQKSESLLLLFSFFHLCNRAFVRYMIGNFPPLTGTENGMFRNFFQMTSAVGSAFNTRGRSSNNGLIKHESFVDENEVERTKLF